MISGLFRYKTFPSLSADSTHKNGFVNQLGCPRGGVRSSEYFSYGLLATVAVVKGIDSVMVFLMVYIVYLLVAIINGFLYDVNDILVALMLKEKKELYLVQHNISRIIQYCFKIF